MATAIPLISIILLGLALLVAAACVIFALRPLRRVAKAPADSENSDSSDSSENSDSSDYSGHPDVSVIVYAFGDTEELPEYLESVLSQQGAGEFEVVVVVDATAESAAMLSEKIGADGRVRLTFVPPGSHNLSRRKLALTLGMKGASGDVAIFTASNCRIPSDRWLADMTAPFSDPSVELALGFTHPDFDRSHGAGKWYRQFDDVLRASSWLGSALGGHPWRGDGMNLAVRRSTFFSHKGFASSIYLHPGEDDLFVHEIATPDNTRVVLTPDSILTSEWSGRSSRIWADNKERYDFTSRWLPKGPRLLSGFLSLSQWLVLGLSAAGALAALPGWLCAPIAGVILLTFWGFEIAAYRPAAARLQAVRLWWAVPLFLLWRPVGNTLFLLSHRSSRYRNFTWQRHS